MTLSRDARSPIRGLRLGALALVGGLTLATRLLEPDPGARRGALLLATLGLGYGHQLGAVCFGRRRTRTWLEHGLRTCTLATAGLAFALGLASPAAPGLMLVLAALAAWHVFENDLAQGPSPSRVRLPPLPRRFSAHLPALLATAAAVAVAIAAPRLAPALVGAGLPPALAAWTPEEVIALLLLYHVLVWIGRSLSATPAGRLGRQRARMLAVHLLPVLALFAIQSAAPVAYLWVASPTLYLFASAAHAVLTSLDRGLEVGSGDENGEIPARLIHVGPAP